MKKRRDDTINVMDDGTRVPQETMLAELTDIEKDIRPVDRDQEEFYKALQKLYDGKNLYFVTELSDKDICDIVVMREIWEWCDRRLDIVKDSIRWKMRLRVSLKRKGRLEFVETFKSRMEAMSNKIQDSGALGWMRRKV